MYGYFKNVEVLGVYSMLLKGPRTQKIWESLDW
jgi:hypothetical protein